MTYLLNDKSKHLHLQHKSLISHYLNYYHILHFHHHISDILCWLEVCSHIGCLCYKNQLCNCKLQLHPEKDIRNFSKDSLEVKLTPLIVWLKHDSVDSSRFVPHVLKVSSVPSTSFSKKAQEVRLMVEWLMRKILTYLVQPTCI